MTEIKVNHKEQKTSEEPPQFGDFSPCPPPTVPQRVRWINGAPFIGDMAPEDFFDQFKEITPDELDRLVEEDQRELEAEASLGNSVKLQAIVGNEGLTQRRSVKMIAREEVRLRYKMMAFVKDALRPICSWRNPVMNCGFTPFSDHVTICCTHSDGVPSAKFKDVVHDHNTWVCPLCSLNIAVGRVKEIREIVWHAKKMDYECYHMTITMAHHEWDELFDMLQDMKSALRDFWGQRKVKALFKSCFVHRISTMEITKGFDENSNGWHPHLHILLIGSKLTPVEVVQRDYEDAWIDALKKYGREGKEGIALQIEPVTNIENYLNKVPCEIGLGNVTKSGHGTHMTFFQMVNYAVNCGSSLIQDEIKSYIREFYTATRGLHQMQKSRGINQFFGVDAKTDKELADQDTEKVIEELLIVDAQEWRRKLDHEDLANLWLMARRSERGEIKSYLRRKGIFMYWDGVEDYLSRKVEDLE